MRHQAVSSAVYFLPDDFAFADFAAGQKNISLCAENQLDAVFEPADFYFVGGYFLIGHNPRHQFGAVFLFDFEYNLDFFGFVHPGGEKSAFLEIFLLEVKDYEPTTEAGAGGRGRCNCVF